MAQAADAPAKAAAAKTEAAPAKPAAQGKVPAGNKECIECHEELKEFHDRQDKTVACTECHQTPRAPEEEERAPGHHHRPGQVRLVPQEPVRDDVQDELREDGEEREEPARRRLANPAWEKLMGPHGFTKEHNMPRSHAFALYDQLCRPRLGGRFENKYGWGDLARQGGNFRIWDLLVDKYPGEPHKAFRPGTAAAANPVCMSCRTPTISSTGRTSATRTRRRMEPDVEGERVREGREPLAQLHLLPRPHGAQPRIIRDGLIQALTRPEKDTLWHKDPKAGKVA